MPNISCSKPKEDLPCQQLPFSFAPASSIPPRRERLLPVSFKSEVAVLREAFTPSVSKRTIYKYGPAGIDAAENGVKHLTGMLSVPVAAAGTLTAGQQRHSDINLLR